MRKLTLILLTLLLVCFAASGQNPLPQFTVGAGIGMDSNAPVAVSTNKWLDWTQQLNGWTSFAIQTDTKTYSYNTIRMVGNAYTLTPGIMRINYQSGYVTLGTIIDAGIVTSQSATGGTVQLGEGLFYNLKGLSPKLSNWYATGIVKASYASISPMPAAGYSIKPVFEFGLTFGLQ